jgi:hypothetical protein
MQKNFLALLALLLRHLKTYEMSAAVQTYRGADKSLARPGGKQATATEDFDFHIFYL